MIVWILSAYLVGSVPFGLLLARAGGYGDIRKIGSGNIGATNVLRTGSRGLAALTVLLDGGKGAAILLVYAWLHPYVPARDSAPPDISVTLHILLGLAAVAGHCFPVWLKFRGGKGFATALGVLLAAAPWAGLAACAAWLATAAATRLSSASALAALAAAPVVAALVYGPVPGLAALAVSVLVAARHRENIRRLWAGTEPRMGGKKGA